MSEQKMYLVKQKQTVFGKEVEVEKSLLHYQKGVTQHYWTDMTVGQYVDSEGNRLEDSKKMVLVPVAYAFMNGIFFPSYLEDKDGNVIKADDGQPVFNADSYKEKSRLIVFGFWADDEKGTVKWDSFRNLISIDFKTFSASNLHSILQTQTRGIDAQGNSVSLPMLRIKLGGLVPTKHPKAKQFDFKVSVDKNLEFEYIVNQWLNDLEYDIYNEEQLRRSMEHTTTLSRYNSSFSKVMPIDVVKDFMPLPSEINRKVLDNGGLLIERGGVNSVMAIAQKSEVEDNVEYEI